ncbi:transposase [Vibrio cholerae]|nr:transposase [Vibrio cholerae]
MISQALLIRKSSVARHLIDYVLSEKLKPECLLAETQTMQLIKHLNK